MITLLRQHAAPTTFLLSKFEQKRESRGKCPRLARVFPVNSPSDLARLSIVCGISENGILLLLTRSISLGTLMNVELRGRTIMNRVAQVTHAARTDGGWIVSCKLDNPFSHQELQELGS
jgi:hypothetical protein